MLYGKREHEIFALSRALLPLQDRYEMIKSSSQLMAYARSVKLPQRSRIKGLVIQKS
jgi:hypothetical protein